MERRDFLKNASMGAAGLAAAAAAAPVMADSTLPTINWRLTSAFPKSLDTIYGGADTIAARVKSLTGGKFNIRPFAAGEIVPGGGASVDAVQAGTVECCHTCSFYSVGKDKTWAFGTAVPFGMNFRSMNAWIHEGGGQKVLDDFFASYGVISFVAGNTGTQMAGWFRKEIKTVADLKGLKMRISGLGGEVFSRLGAVPQQIPGADIYPALEKGTIDATEWIGPYDDEKLGFDKVAKYYYYPGFWESGPVITCFVNKKEWDKLPKEYQSAFEAACHEANVTMMAKYDHKNPIALSKLIAGGTKVQRLSDEILEAAWKASQEMYAEESAKNPAFKKVYDHFSAYRKSQLAWLSTAEMSLDRFMQAHNK
jgi:TRAP-type mannitol/chloroaromatic compound transport system substrate-binding protein